MFLHTQTANLKKIGRQTFPAATKKQDKMQMNPLVLNAITPYFDKLIPVL